MATPAAQIRVLQYDILSGQSFDENSKFYFKKVAFGRNWVYFVGGGETLVIQMPRVLGIHVQEVKGCVVIVFSRENVNPGMPSTETYKMFLRGSLLDLLELYPGDIASRSDYGDFLAPVTVKESLTTYPPCPKLRQKAALDAGYWLNDDLLWQCMQSIEKSHVKPGAKVTLLDSLFFLGLCKGSKPKSRYFQNRRLLDDDFIFILVNLNKDHWILLVVCYPGLDGCYDIDTGERCDSRSTRACIKSCNDVGILVGSSSPGISPSPFINSEMMSGLQTLENLERSPHKTPKRVKQPCILILDPSTKYGSYYDKPVNTIKRFLDSRLTIEERSGLDFSEIPVHVPLVPKLDNNIDCGIYVMHYFYEFLKFIESDKFDLSMPILQLKDCMPVEAVIHTRRYIFQVFKQKLSSKFPVNYPLVPSDALFTKIPDRDDDGLA